MSEQKIKTTHYNKEGQIHRLYGPAVYNPGHVDADIWYYEDRITGYHEPDDCKISITHIEAVLMGGMFSSSTGIPPITEEGINRAIKLLDGIRDIATMSDENFENAVYVTTIRIPKHLRRYIPKRYRRMYLND